MPSISSSTSASPAFQDGFAQLKIQQAKRNAEQAEATAQALQSQAAGAARTAARAQENARNLSVQSDQAQDNVGRARQGLEAIRSLSETSSRLEQIYDRVAKAVNPEASDTDSSAPVEPTASVAPSLPAIASKASAATSIVSSPSVTVPSVNAQGQPVGTLVNITV